MVQKRLKRTHFWSIFKRCENGSKKMKIWYVDLVVVTLISKNCDKKNSVWTIYKEKLAYLRFFLYLCAVDDANIQKHGSQSISYIGFGRYVGAYQWWLWSAQSAAAIHRRAETDSRKGNISRSGTKVRREGTSPCDEEPFLWGSGAIHGATCVRAELRFGD